MIKVNLNQNVTIKPTEKGIKLIADRYNIPGLPVKWYKKIDDVRRDINESGEMTIQIHQFMEYFGCLDMTLPEYVDLNIIIHN